MADENDTLGALDRDVKNKIAAKYDASKEAEVQFWMEDILQEPFQESFQESLKSGVRLCNLLNRIAPGAVRKINNKEMPFSHRENISSYLDACKGKGMSLVDLFDTQDLYDAKNMVSVINHFYQLSGYAKGWGFEGPFLAGTSEIKGRSASTSKPKANANASVSSQTMGSYGVDTGKDPTRVARTGVRNVNEEAKFANVQAADENDTLGALDRDVKNKIAAKYDPAREAEVVAWIEAVTGANLGGSLADGLHDGKTICKLINTIFPGTVTDISNKSMAFFQRENVSKYLDGCKKAGMNPVDLFDTQDLYDNKNIVNVINHFFSFSAFARGNSSFSGPFIGVKFSEENRRDFTDEQLRAGQFVGTAQTMGSYGVVDNHPDVKFTHIIKDVDQIKRTQDASASKAKNMYG